MDSYQWRRVLALILQPEDPEALDEDECRLLGFYNSRPLDKAHVREAAIDVLAERLGDD